jgi:large subunit ribosomal protein L22
LKYSYNLERKELVFAHAKDINASYKDLCVVCDAVRYHSIPQALKILDSVINDGRPIEFRRHNRYMGSRHELGGKKGRYPIKCAALVRKVVVNAAANAKNKGQDPEMLYVVHATANKTQIIPRSPSKGIRSISGGYGYGAARRSNLELAKIEIAVGNKDSKELGARMKRVLKAISKKEKPVELKTVQKKKTTAAKPAQPKTTAAAVPKPVAAPQAMPNPETKQPIKEFPKEKRELKEHVQESNKDKQELKEDSQKV